MRFNLPKLFKDSVYVTVSQGINYATRAVWGILLARWLGTEYLGIYFYYIGIFSIAASLREFGKIGFLMKDLNSNETPRDLYYYYVNKHLYIVVALMLGSLIFLKSSEIRTDYLIIGISSLIIAYSESFANVLTTWHFYKERAPFIALLDIVKSILTLLTGLLFYLATIPNYFLIMVPAFYSLSRLLYILYTVLNLYSFKMNTFIFQKCSFNDLKIVIKNTWIFGLLSLLASVQSQSDPALLKYLGFTPHDFGIIGAASRMKGILMLAGGAILNVLFPRMSKDFSVSGEKFSATFYRILKPLFWVNIVFCSVLIFFSKDIISLLYGRAFAGAIPFMMLFSIGSITPLLVLLSSAVIAVGNQRFVLLSTTILYLIYPLLKIIMIPLFGTITIGWLEAVIPYVSAVIFFYFLRNTLQPRINFRLILKMLALVIIGVALPFLMVTTGLNNLFYWIIIVLVLFITSYFLRFTSIREVLPKLELRSIFSR
jgi:O-antigen/teichoic acid export membrane protein